MASINRAVNKNLELYQTQNDIVCVWRNCRADADQNLGAPLCFNHAKQVSVQVMLLSSNTIRPITKKLGIKESQPKDKMGRVEQRKGLIYFIQFSDRIKIGFTTNFPLRMKSLPHDRILALTPGTITTERMYHKKFEDLRLTGEWFSAGKALTDYIAGIPKHDLIPA